ncbi:MAG: aminotransferase class I/II-fold pyridoxal phosphate-dependent enzyme [Cyclobacteriaceae bacterium]|jgi:aspartate/methionine/tyrosine aminotransferase|nr:aminotransferase class I/II-fold pyridoxal phosphate-dependent enzyme [Cyclobacteriaceae bacterium]
MIQTAHRIQNVEEYYFSKKLAEVRSLDRPDSKIINLGIGSPDLAPAPATIEALCETAAQPTSHGYQSYKGVPALRQAIVSFYQRVYGVSLNAEADVLPLMGSKEGIMHISLAFLNEGEEVLVPNPGYPTYSSVTQLCGGKIRYYALSEKNKWQLNLDDLRSQDLSRVKIMWVNYPHMPTGTVASREQLTALVALARERNFLLVNDNPYSLILNETPISLLSIPGAHEVALELNSLSKSHNMAGWRVGWVAGQRELIDAVLRVKSNMDSGMFLGLQQAAAEALKSDDAWFARQNSIYRQRKKKAVAILKTLGCEVGEGQSGLFVWARAPRSIANVEKWIDEILYGARVFLTPGFIFGDEGKNYVRISLCADERVFEEAHQRIARWMETVIPNPVTA